jgi:hypothetical protein
VLSLQLAVAALEPLQMVPTHECYGSVARKSGISAPEQLMGGRNTFG